jgi:hypothetical protein
MGVADDLKKKYSKYVDAEALIFAYDKPPHPHKALRIEAQSLGKEFTDDAYIGTGASSRTYTDTFTMVMGFCFPS